MQRVAYLTEEYDKSSSTEENFWEKGIIVLHTSKICRNLEDLERIWAELVAGVVFLQLYTDIKLNTKQLCRDRESISFASSWQHRSDFRALPLKYLPYLIGKSPYLLPVRPSPLSLFSQTSIGESRSCRKEILIALSL